MADLVPGAMISLVPRVLSPQLKPLYVIDRAAISVGRHPSNDIALPLESVSRFHARLELRGKDIYAVDLGSSNGTYVNRARVTEGVLTDQDEVSFGNIAFVFNYRLQTVAPLPLRDERSESQVRLVSGDDLGLQTVVQKETLAADTTPARDFQSEITDLSSLNRARKLLSILYEFHKQLGYKSEPEEIYQTALDLIFDALPCDRGVILTKAEDEGDLIPVKTKFRSGDAKPDIAISRTIIDRCLKDRVAVLSRDAMTDTRFKRSESILLHDIRSAMCAPLISRNQVQAICFVDTSEAKRAFGEADLAFFASLTAEVATLLDNASMRREMLINQQLAVIGQTITGIAHNIKNILFLTKGGTELMDRCVSEKNFEALERTWGVVRRNLDRVYVMVQDMLEFSRQRVAEKHVANVNRIILDTVEEIREDLDKKRIHLELSLDESAPDMPMDDQGFYRALMNLIVNASEAIEDEGKGRILIRTRVTENGWICVSVHDNGCGIPTEKMQQIFLPFFTTKGSKGTGLGLPMTKKIIESMGGKLLCKSKEGAGTTFEIALPPEAPKGAAPAGADDAGEEDDNERTPQPAG